MNSKVLNVFQLLQLFICTVNSFLLPLPNSTLQECLQSNGIASEDIIYRNLTSHQYNQLNFQWNTYKGTIYPAIYVTPRNSNNVRAAVICSRLFDIRIVPKSGGHSYVKYGFGDNSSLVVDLVHMDKILINTTASTVHIGAGNRQGRLYYHLWLSGYTASLGFCPAVGIAGVSLGGGYGLVSRLFGLTADNVVEFEMVTASGSLLTINSQSNTDLYFALRGGGGGNFGIVTNLKLKIYRSPTFIIWATREYSTEHDFFKFFHAWQKHVASLELDRSISFAASFQVSTFRFRVAKFEYGANPQLGLAMVRKVLEDFPTGSNSILEARSYDQYLVTSIGRDYPHVTHPSHLANITDYPTEWKQMVSIIVGKVLNETETVEFHTVLRHVLLKPGISVWWEHFGADSQMTDIAPTETAFVHRGPHAMYMMQASHVMEDSWQPDPESVLQLGQFFTETQRILEHRYSYQNYLDEGMSDYLQRYYGQNVDRLVQVKAEVDPDNVFHHPLSIPTSLVTKQQ